MTDPRPDATGAPEPDTDPTTRIPPVPDQTMRIPPVPDGPPLIPDGPPPVLPAGHPGSDQSADVSPAPARGRRRIARSGVMLTLVAVLTVGAGYVVHEVRVAKASSTSQSSPGVLFPGDGSDGGIGSGSYISKLASAPAHSVSTVKDTTTGQWVTQATQRGTVTAVSGHSITVKSGDGTTWTWDISDAEEYGNTDLQKGDMVWVRGTSDSTSDSGNMAYSATDIVALDGDTTAPR
ncbi:hypothetical protein [Streptomyces fractus]|uniref:hypothetical protein n=1 Tax=Streptomyces fractus TaxID=641806 RepID=UPI003CE70A09